MTDITPALVSPAVNAGGDPPDDFGADVIAEFAKRGMVAREFGTGGAAMADDATADAGTPPGGWPALESTTPTTPDPRSATPDPRAPASASTSTSSDTPADDGTADGVAATGEAATPPAASGDDTSDRSGGAGAGAPDADAAVAAGEVDGTTSPPASPSGYRWTEGDQDVTFSDDQVRQALAISAWATGLPDQTRTAFAAIEQGQAVAIPRADFDQFQAWREQQQRSQRDADLSNLDVDPEVAKVITNLRDEITQLRGQTSPVSSQNPAQDYSVLNANLSGTAQRFDAAVNAYAMQNGLDQAQMEALTQAALNAQAFRFFGEQLAVTNPVTGAVIQPGDPALIVQRSLDSALVSNPALHTVVLARRQAPAAGTSASPSPAADPSAALNLKKARASSVASAPSAAVTPSPRTTAQMTPDQVIAAMEADIARQLNAS